MFARVAYAHSANRRPARSGHNGPEHEKWIMEILEAFDATGSVHSAAQLARVDPKTVRRYAAARDAGRPVTGASRRGGLVGEHMGQTGGGTERSSGERRAAGIHVRLVAMEFTGTERTTRRAVAEAKAA